MFGLIVDGSVMSNRAHANTTKWHIHSQIPGPLHLVSPWDECHQGPTARRVSCTLSHGLRCIAMLTAVPCETNHMAMLAPTTSEKIRA